MTSEEIVSEISRKNRDALPGLDDCAFLTREQVLDLMDAAAMRGFQFGSNVALSMVQGALLVQLARLGDGESKPSA
ncbi:hypothetical protein EDC30_11379 [Paucimonas lemoignei]|uniref:Uncharacterized protein n=1 Tax=Paucimonas lemoignei TaxID=29443 RepID=A0A4R3HQM7_PAULE|nr:hypothetical protein [Paucimonas lemoignei]TCS34383.1 hypothetical protein EDC30_11379 [Paucimonas lemoignei]